MICPYCSSPDLRVVDKRDTQHESAIRRRRECQDCFKRFTTYERIETIELTVEKKDGSLEQFNREKLRRSIKKSVGNSTTIEEEQISRIIDDIEMRLLNRKSTIVSSSSIGKLVLTRLKNIDPVAYMRFASVYKEFQSIDDFDEEIKSLTKQK